MNQQTTLIIQARAGSTRLPGKSLKPFASSDSLLGLVIYRLQRAFSNESIVVATSDRSADDNVAAVAEKSNVGLFRGDEQDVLSRFIGAADAVNATRVVRICGDNPFLSNEHILALTDESLSAMDYISFKYQSGKPTIKSHCGIFAELISTATLNKIAASTHQRVYREHITSFVLDHPEKFNCHFMLVPCSIETAPWLRLTVDTAEDFETAEKIYRSVIKQRGEDFSIAQLMDCINGMPNMQDIMNAQIVANEK